MRRLPRDESRGYSHLIPSGLIGENKFSLGMYLMAGNRAKPERLEYE
jgi:hypothetical protein